MPRTDTVSINSLLLSVAANTLVVSTPPIGLLRCDAVMEDLQEFLKQKPLLRWSYSRAVGQALSRPTLPGIQPAVLQAAADLLCVLAAIRSSHHTM